jgi:hypothetical protein
MNTYCIRATALLSLLLCLPIVAAPARVALAADKTGGGVVLSPSDAQGNEIKLPCLLVQAPSAGNLCLQSFAGVDAGHDHKRRAISRPLGT